MVKILQGRILIKKIRYNTELPIKHTFVTCNGWITEVIWDAFTATSVIVGLTNGIQSTADQGACRNTVTL